MDYKDYTTAQLIHAIGAYTNHIKAILEQLQRRVDDTRASEAVEALLSRARLK